MAIVMPTTGARTRVLLVEDDTAIRELMQAILAEMGLAVDVASRGVHAMELAREHRPELAILDLGLPEMYGATLASKLRSLYPDLLLMVVSALSSSTVAEDAWQMGAFTYITKPFELADFAAAVQRGLDLARGNTPTPK